MTTIVAALMELVVFGVYCKWIFFVEDFPGNSDNAMSARQLPQSYFARHYDYVAVLSCIPQVFSLEVRIATQSIKPELYFTTLIAAIFILMSLLNHTVFRKFAL